MVNRQVVGAHYGARDWLLQRITAVILLAYTFTLLAFLYFTGQSDYQQWKQLFSYNWVRILSIISISALLLHAWVGMRDIWMDYVKPLGVRLFLHSVTILWLLACFVYAVTVLWGNNG